MEEQFYSLKTEWNILKEKWFVGEKMDPVFEGTVRDFCQFDSTLQDIYKNVEIFMHGIEQCCEGVSSLGESVVTGLGHYHDGHIATESCKLREACHQITRGDAPHSAIAKLRRDMDFNILNPMRMHLLNNRNLKSNLDVRRRRLLELNSAKKPFDLLLQKNTPQMDPKFVRTKAQYESAKNAFLECDRQVFEWLYILEDYKGDILDSTLQTLKYLQYEFFASAAHSISASLPARMEFRPMVEMTPDHLETQVEMELKEQEEENNTSDKEGQEPATTFSVRLIEKMAKQGGASEPPNVQVDYLSLQSLLGHGFEEAPARRALRVHNNDTQKALDWLVDGAVDQKKKINQAVEAADGVRLPTTIKRIQKLRLRRKKIALEKEKRRQAEKEKEEQGKKQKEQEKTQREQEKKKKKKKRKKAADTSSDSSDSERSNSSVEDRERTSKIVASVTSAAAASTPEAPVTSGMDLIGLDDEASGQPGATLSAHASASNGVPLLATPLESQPTPAGDLLGFDESQPPAPMEFSKDMHLTELPPNIPSFDPINCLSSQKKSLSSNASITTTTNACLPPPPGTITTTMPMPNIGNIEALGSLSSTAAPTYGGAAGPSQAPAAPTLAPTPASSGVDALTLLQQGKALSQEQLAAVQQLLRRQAQTNTTVSSAAVSPEQLAHPPTIMPIMPGPAASDSALLSISAAGALESDSALAARGVGGEASDALRDAGQGPVPPQTQQNGKTKSPFDDLHDLLM